MEFLTTHSHHHIWWPVSYYAKPIHRAKAIIQCSATVILYDHQVGKSHARLSHKFYLQYYFVTDTFTQDVHVDRTGLLASFFPNNSVDNNCVRSSARYGSRWVNKIDLYSFIPVHKLLINCYYHKETFTANRLLTMSISTEVCIIPVHSQY